MDLQHSELRDPETAGDGDLTALAWVHDELRRSLDTAHKSLRRLLRDVEQRHAAVPIEGRGVLPAVQQARTLVHQGVGVLEMIGLPAAARCLGASEQLLQVLVAEPGRISAELVAVVERVSFALLDFLGRRLAGQPVSSLGLFPAYRAALQLAGAERIHPADLWTAPDVSALAALPADVAPLQPADPRVPAAIEASLIDAMRGQVDAQARLSRIFAGVAVAADAGHAPLWQLASAFYEAQAWRLLQADVYAQRLGSRLLSLLRASAQGEDIVPPRLLQDLAFFCARARQPASRDAAPRLARVRQALELPALADEDYQDSPLGRFDPALVPQARRRLAAFKDIWAVAASGDEGVLPACAEQVALVAESVRQLYPGGEALARALTEAVDACAQSGQAPAAELAMEMATALLCLDATLDDLDQPELPQRTGRLSQRLRAVSGGQPAEPIEPWMEALYREVSDRQTMGSVVQELRAALAEVEQQLDRFLRNPRERELLIPVPAQLATMRGVLSVLGLGPAAQAVQRMRQDVDQIIAGADASQDAETTARLADNLGVMSFLIDLLGVQPQLAKSLFRFDADSGRFTAVMGRGRGDAPARPQQDGQLRERVQALAEGPADHQELARELELLSHHAAAADASALAQAASQARRALDGAADGADERLRADVAQSLAALVSPPLATAPVPAAPAPADDEDMREVFFEEAAEVIGQAREALSALEHSPRDIEAMTAVRRAFHTLKGSSRMVHLGAFGEAAWACEQLYNARLAHAEAEVDAGLRQFTVQALDELHAWTDALASGGTDGGHDGQALIARAEALREPARVETAPTPQDLPADETVEAKEAAPAEAALPAAPFPLLDLDLDLTLDAPAEPAPAAPPAADVTAPLDPADWPLTSTEAPAELAETVDFELDLDALDEPAPRPAPAAPTLTLVHSAPPEADEDAEPAEDDDVDRFKVVGALRVPIALFNIYLNEADEQSRRLCTELAEWQLELERPVGETAVALAHSMAGNSATVGYAALSGLARRLEHQLAQSQARGRGQPAEAQLYLDVAEEIRRLLHQFAAGFLRAVPPELEARLAAHEQQETALVVQQAAHALAADEGPAAAPEAPVTDFAAAYPDTDTVLGAVQFTPLRPDDEPPVPPAAPQPAGRHTPLILATGDIDAIDVVDPELFEIFVEEAQELIPQLGEQLRLWDAEPGEPGRGIAAMRALHTLKGGARLAGAMRLGEMAHRLETAVEPLTAHGAPDAAALAALHAGVDALAEELQRLVGGGPLIEPAPPAEASAVPAPEPAPAAAPVGVPDAAITSWDTAQPAVDWSGFAAAAHATLPQAADGATGAAGQVRVRAQLLDRLVSHAGEVGATRSRIESEVGQMRSQLRELTDNLERLRRQLRDLELQAETQMASRLEAARHAQQAFDPLEMDRFTRVQELTRMLTESVGDVGTVQRSLQQALQTAEDQLAAQSRLTRDLQDDLLRARMVEFDTVADRLYRVVRQAAKETGKQVRLNLTGGNVELDRSVLDRMTPAFEHLLRNAVVHGVEPPALREATGKAATGTIDVGLRQFGNEVRIEVRDDGAGLDLARIAERARAAGLLAEADRPTEADLAQLIFRPGFTTVSEVTELAGRGIGMDVVRSEVTAMGGRVETSSATGQGTAFRLVLPLTTAVTQVVALACEGLVVAVPSILVELVRRVPAAELEAAYASGQLRDGERLLPFFWLGGLLEHGVRGQIEGRTGQVLIVRSASQRVAVHVTEVLGNQEVVVKNLGPQLARLPGLAGMSLLANGQTVLIYNPVALAAVYGEAARARLAEAAPVAGQPQAVQPAVPLAPLVLVVDDSLTVRRVTQRLLLRDGYRVALARDGLEALELLAAERPALMLSDIEMPRMDGFDLVRNVRAEPRWHDLPVIMITSRIAQKHRDHARELGVDHYLGKPYDEEALLALVHATVAPQGTPAH